MQQAIANISPHYSHLVTSIMSGALSQIQLGANAKAQAICFALCLAAGLASGVFALLYFRKSNKIEQIFTDLFATVMIGVVFFVCVEFFLDGKIELYGAVAYVLGVCALPVVRNIVKKHKKTRKENIDAQSK